MDQQILDQLILLNALGSALSWCALAVAVIVVFVAGVLTVKAVW